MRFHDLLKQLIKHFFNGLLFMVPLLLTVYVFYFVFIKIDHLVLNIPIPGAGLILTILFIIVVGFFASNIVTQRYFNYIDILFAKLPLVKIMYSSIKDLINAFVGREKRFNRPVLVTFFPEQGIKVFGFVTSEGVESLGIGPDILAVYIPQSYNFAGNLFLVPREYVQFLEMSSAKVMALIVSAAVAGSNTIHPHSTENH